jgi:hypothetical protein
LPKSISAPSSSPAEFKLFQGGYAPSVPIFIDLAFAIVAKDKTLSG